MNIPYELTDSTSVTLSRPAIRAFTSDVVQDSDPRGANFYWIAGHPLTDFPPDTDAFVTRIKEEISISPIVLEDVPPNLSEWIWHPSIQKRLKK